MDGLSPATSAAVARAATAPAVPPAPELSIVVPTFNERTNVPILVERLSRLLPSADWEILFVDDNSPDGTAAVARAIGETDSRVRCIRRFGRRGLAGACLEGMLASQARYLAVMDADLQHDEGLLVAMLDQLRTGRADLVVASRYLSGGSAAGLSTQRSRMSRAANALVRFLLGIDLTDPMSGHFMIGATPLSRWPPRSPRRASRSCSIFWRPGAAGCALSNCRRRFASANTARASSTARSRSILPRW